MVTEVKAYFENSGVSWGTVLNAKDGLGLVSRRIGGSMGQAWFWHLEDRIESDVEAFIQAYYEHRDRPPDDGDLGPNGLGPDLV
jgi:hypothetical protein